MKRRTSGQKARPSIKKTREFINDLRDLVHGLGTATSVDLCALRERVLAISSEIPRFRLTGAERKHLSSFLFVRALDLVNAVEGALRQAPQDYAHIPIDRRVLEEKQDRALAFKDLADLLQTLTDRCRDLSLWEQADCIRMSMGLVRQVRQEGLLPIPPPGWVRRAFFVISAEAALFNRKKMESAQRRRRSANQVPENDPFTLRALQKTLRLFAARAESEEDGGAEKRRRSDDPDSTRS